MNAYIGLMSGTSADGVDAIIAKFSSVNRVHVMDSLFMAYDQQTKQTIQTLQLDNSIAYHEVCKLDIKLGYIYANVINKLIKKNPHLNIVAAGCHGQTIQHRPNDATAYSLQLGSGAVISQKTRLTVVNNFRSRDLASGGQGAPLAPSYHQGIFSSPNEKRAIVNIGGISNITYLSNHCPVLGFDSGPGNTLIDKCCNDHFNLDYDHGGQLAATGKLDKKLVKLLLSDCYINAPYPKSTGQEYFNYAWLNAIAGKRIADLSKIDLLSSLTAFTAASISLNIEKYCPEVEGIYVCGGGAHNLTLMRMLAKYSGVKVETSSALGVEPEWVEACVFAWLTKQTLSNQAIDLRSITGSSQPNILGSIWPN